MSVDGQPTGAPLRPPSPRDRAKAEPGDIWGRRDVLTSAGWIGVLATLAVSFAGFARLLFRRAPVEPPTVFTAGRPADYRPGTVSDRFLRQWRIFIVREERKVFAVYGKCTHLGCTPRWDRRADRFKCPCHGSGFTSDGVNFEGPAPRPLPRARVWLDRDGQLRVDVGKRYPQADWGDEGAFVDLGGLGGLGGLGASTGETA